MVSDRPDATEHFGQAVSEGSLLNGAMPGRSSRSQLTAGAPGGSLSNEKLEVEDAQGWTEWKQTPSDHAPQPELDFQGKENEHLQSRLKVAEWQLRNSNAGSLSSAELQEQHGQDGGPGKEPPVANGAPATFANLANGVVSNGAGANAARGKVDSPHSQVDTSSPSTQAETSPSQRGSELLLTEQTRRLAAVRTVGLRAEAPSLEALQARLQERELALAQAHVREAELQRETRVLAARLAQLRMAHEAQAGKLAEAALRAVAARSEVVRENAVLAQQLAQAQNAQATYAQQLLPLLATYGLTAPASDPHAVTSNVAKLVDRLVAEINLLEKVVSVGGPVLEQRLADVAAEAGPLPSLQGSLPAPQTPQDVRGSADSALSLAVGMGPAPPSQQGPTSGPPLFPGGHWTPLPPGTATLPETRERPPLGSTPATPKPTVTIAEAVRPAGDDGAGAHWPFGSGSGVPERPMSVRFRRAPEVAAPSSGGPGPAGGASWQEHAGAAVQPGPGGGSLARRSPPWRPQDSAVSVRFKEEKGPGGSDSLVREGAGQSGPGRGAAWAGSPLNLRDSQRNLLDSVASLGRGLGASQNPSMGQVSSLAEGPEREAEAAESGGERGDALQPDEEQDDDALPAIVNLKIAGEAALGSKLTACGHSVNGSSLCYFQWVRHYQDGTAFYIEGAKQPEYLVSADDARCQITVECLPVDSRGRKGELVSAAANNGEPIPLDEAMSHLLIGYQASGKAKFNVLDAHNAVEHELVIDRRSFTIKRGKDVVIKEPYSGEVQAEIVVNDVSIVLIHISQGRRMDLDCINSSSRDLAVLTLRSFVEAHLQYLEEKKATKKGFFSRK